MLPCPGTFLLRRACAFPRVFRAAPDGSSAAGALQRCVQQARKEFKHGNNELQVSIGRKQSAVRLQQRG
jgi:hypothetical protein